MDERAVVTPITARRSQAERRAEAERRVLDAAMRLIAARGSQNVSLRDVGLEAGYSRGIVNHHFGTKRDLLKAVIIHAQQAFTLPPTDRTGLDLLAFTIEKYLDYLHERRPAGQVFLLLWAEAAGADASLQSVFSERDMYFRQLLADQVTEGVREGSIRGDADPYAIAFSVLGMLRGIGLQLLLVPDAVPLSVIRDGAVQTVRRGLAPRLPGENGPRALLP